MDEFAGDSLHFAEDNTQITFHFAAAAVICFATLNLNLQLTAGLGTGAQ